VTLGVIGFVSQTAWKARKDTAAALAYVSPFEMHDLVRNVASYCDHLTVLGDFNMAEADSLAKQMPEISLIVGSNIRIDQSQRKGRSMIVGMPPRGNNGNYVEWNLASRDTTDAASRVVSLDDAALVDSTVLKLLTDVKEKLSGPAPMPSKPAVVTAPPPTPVAKPVHAAVAPVATPVVAPKPAPASAPKQEPVPAPKANPPAPMPPVDPEGTKQ
jgi:hypothetical protein